MILSSIHYDVRFSHNTCVSPRLDLTVGQQKERQLLGEMLELAHSHLTYWTVDKTTTLRENSMMRWICNQLKAHKLQRSWGTACYSQSYERCIRVATKADRAKQLPHDVEMRLLYIQLDSSEHWQHKRKYKIIEKINNFTKKQTNNWHC